MTSTHTTGGPVDAVPAVSAPAGVVTTAVERALSAGHWLLVSAPLRAQARVEWEERGAAWLRPGVLFAAVSMPADVLHAALGSSSPQECAGRIVEEVEQGPVFYSPDGFQQKGSYTALVPARVARLRILLPGAVTCPQRALLLVPAPGRTEPEEGGPWWVSPPSGPALLCPPERVAELACAGRAHLVRSKGRRDA
ncbi:hypothetical protein ACFUIW_13830 [Streptomyces sp. NPDC057245]|uniref:hypothetical protein n=1 Tax=Streptomyces TaxID=1883 RepID=UPI001C1E002B|nr:hypothetical protein [Streptomyces sp. A108]MBU6536370.1 hypothetical protein [Streptomyces sp. A108]